jgi:uncharacterized protein (DUF1499 family)
LRYRKVKKVLYTVLFAVGFAVLAVVVMFAFLSAASRRPTDLGITNGRLKTCPSSPNCVCSQDIDPGHHTEPIHYSAAAPIAVLGEVIGTLPGGKVISSTDKYLHAEFTSQIFRFVDDVEFQLDPEAKLIHCRSASRVGHSDLGVNRARVEAIRKAFAERDGTPAG